MSLAVLRFTSSTWYVDYTTSYTMSVGQPLATMRTRDLSYRGFFRTWSHELSRIYRFRWTHPNAERFSASVGLTPSLWPGTLPLHPTPSPENSRGLAFHACRYVWFTPRFNLTTLLDSWTCHTVHPEQSWDMRPFFQTQSNPVPSINLWIQSNPVHKCQVLNRTRKLFAAYYSNADS